MKDNYEALYDKYKDDSTLLKLENFALWTIPSAFPDKQIDFEMKGDMDIENDYQSIGATLVNFLAAKLTGLLFPTTQSFFKIQPTETMLSIATEAFGVDKAEINNRLVKLENDACNSLYQNASYAQLVQMIRYLVITGNCLFKRIDGKLTVYSLRNYAQLRDNEGTVLDVILKENFAYGSLPPEVQLLVNKPVGTPEFESVIVYTRIKRSLQAGRPQMVVSQQINGVDIGGESVYPENLCPYRTVVWNLVNGDSNGRGLVEEHAGDFAKLSDLSKALAMYEIETCRVIHLVKPGSSVDVDAMQGLPNGAWAQGDPQQVVAHEAGDAQKIQQLAAEIQTIHQRLAQAFMYQGNMREGERVTAEEISMNAQEAEKALGGVYSQLSQGIHLPLSYLLCLEVEPAFLTAIIAGEVTLDVVTGLPALGRSTVVTQILQAIQELSVIVPAMGQLSPRFDTERVVDLVLQARGVNLKDVMMTPEQLKAKQEQQQAAQAQQQQAALVGASGAATAGAIGEMI